MEGISPPEPEQVRGVYSSAKDDETAMSNGEYLATLSHQQVRRVKSFKGVLGSYRGVVGREGEGG